MSGNDVRERSGVRVSIFVVLTALGPACVFWDMDDWTRVRDAGTEAGVEAAVTDPYAETVLADRPLGYWRLNEPVGATTAHDSSGNGHHAAVVGAVTFQVAGAVASDPAANFGPAAAGWLDMGTTLTLRPPYTLEAWIKPVPATGDSTFRRVIGRETAPTRTGFGIWYNETPSPRAGMEQLVDDIGTSTVAALRLGESFLHLVGTFDGTSEEIFVDGASMLRGRAPAPPEVSAPLFCGTAPSSRTSSFFRGAIDEVAVYAHVLDAEAIARHWRARTAR